MNLWKKITYLKKGLQVCIALNVLCIITGGVIGSDHWITKKKYITQSHVIFKDLNEIEKLRVKSFKAINQAPLSKKSSTYETDLFNRWSQWQSFEVQIRRLEKNKVLPPQNFSFEPSNGPSPESLKKLLSLLGNVHKSKLLELQEMQVKISSFHIQLIIVAALTLIFGILLPGLLFGLLTKLLNTARRELQSQVKEWVDGWVSLSTKNEPFKDPQFWINISLLSVELFAQHSRHPMAMISGDISKLVRNELNKPHRDQNPQEPASAA